MREGQPSRTAIMVAALRALHPRLDRPVVFDDPFARAVLPPQVAQRVAEQPESFSTSFMATYLRTFVVVRSRFAEDQLAEAVKRGVRQYVVLGAGFDTFALRNPFDDVRVFELDHPATQKTKLALLRAARITPPANAVYAAVDLASASLEDALAGAGFDRGQASVFAWLGVSMYLERSAIRTTLRSIASLPDATVIFDFAPRPRWFELVPRLILSWRARRVAKLGEPWKSFFTPDEMRRELTDAGFRASRIVNGDELSAMYLSGARRRLTRWSNIAVASST